MVRAMARFAIVGSGAWGTAIAAHLARLEHEVVMWAFESEVAEEITTWHANSIYLSGVPLPESVRASSEMGAVVRDAEIVVLVPPSSHMRSVSALAGGAIRRDAIVVVATKGIEERSLLLMSEVLAENIPSLDAERLAFLSGPTFAREVVRGLPTDVVVASVGMVAARKVQELVHSLALRVYTSADPIGVQVGGAIKNVLAIATGACDGLRFGTNARAALITRGLAEITRLGVKLGADPLTFLGMAGVGDLVLTCTGDLSRNRQLGMRVAEGVDPAAYLASQRAVAEGFSTSAAAWALARKFGVDMPITEQVYHVLHRGRPLLEAARALMERRHTEELVGIRETGRE
jgi:glycerol-3-phosphate dehydrogenase (NAD(P)+)